MRTELLYCGHTDDADATGRCIDPATGWRKCRACAADMERAGMIEHGNACLYLTQRDELITSRLRELTWHEGLSQLPQQSRYVCTDWLGGLRFSVFNYRHSKHGGGFGSQREDFDFHGPDGYVWHGIVRGDMQLARCKRTKKLSNGRSK